MPEVRETDIGAVVDAVDLLELWAPGAAREGEVDDLPELPRGSSKGWSGCVAWLRARGALPSMRACA